ncbi:carbohydrate ABC transporter permease [Niallia sp. 03133]|uniref:carbohydrate ABC transporter permease n=1 Tax=Niallia sp. 03133 TaxID=3458060 RepID=UPI0040440C00
MKGKKTNRLFFYLMIILVTGLSFFPLYWIFITSIKQKEELYSIPATLITFKPTIKHYIDVFSAQAFASYYWNSTVVAALTVVTTLTFGSMIAYAIARLQFRGKAVLLLAITATSMFPPMTMVLPIFMALRDLHLLNTYSGLSLTHAAFGLPMVVWLLSALFKEIPKEIEEASLIDGYNRFQSFIKIMLPLSLPAMVTAAVLVFVHSWNEFLFAFILMSDPERKTLPVAIMMFPGENDFPWATISAAIILAVIPLILLIFLFQKRLIQGMTNGSIKG